MKEKNETKKRSFLTRTPEAAKATEDYMAYYSENMPYSDAQILEGKGKWVPIHCHQNCSGMCLNKAYIVDGVCVRQKTDDVNPDTPERPQQRGCLRGRSLRQQVYNTDRLKYPMKRKHWQPGGGENAHGELRGKDEWERISWDEALTLITDELKRVYKEYGPTAVICNGWRWAPGSEFLKAAGGCIFNAEVESYGTWGFKPAALGLYTWGTHADIMMGNDRFDLPNADTIVFYGCNPVWAQTGQPHHFFKQAMESGTRFVTVGPSYNVTSASYDARWIRLRPGTDTAFLLAVMYEMLRLDGEEKNIIDWDFLNERTVGFDMEHMPEDAKLDECMKGYLLGEYDGIPKTPAWASEICGTPEEDITWYARMSAKTNNVMYLHSYAAARVCGAENLPQAFMTVAAMGGHMGKPGNACASLFSWDCGDTGPRLIATDGKYLDPSRPNPVGDNCMIEGAQWWHSLLEGKYISTTKGSHVDSNNVEFHKAIEKPCNPRIMFAPNSNFMQTRQNLNDGIKCMRQADMCVSLEIKMSLNAEFADILLPVSTHWEGNLDPDNGPLNFPYLFGDGNGQKQRKDAILSWWPPLRPMYETREEKWILRSLCEKMGLDPDDVYPMSNYQEYFNYFLGMKYIDKDNETWKPMLTWTEEHQKKYGINNPPQEGAMDFDEFLERGSFVLERTPDDARNYIGYRDSMKHVDGTEIPAWPRPSKSGRLEIYCQAKADAYNCMELNPEPIKPYPNYFVPVDGYECTFSDWEHKIKGPYPLQAYTPHYLRRAHSCYDNMAWTQEAFKNPVFMNASDAEERDIQAGDTVMIFNQYGKCLRKAQPLQSMMPGTVAIPHGVRSVLDETDPDDIIDRGGSEQILYGPVASNYYHHLNGYNSLLVDICKYEGEPIPEDYDRKNKPFLTED